MLREFQIEHLQRDALLVEGRMCFRGPLTRIVEELGTQNECVSVTVFTKWIARLSSTGWKLYDIPKCNASDVLLGGTATSNWGTVSIDSEQIMHINIPLIGHIELLRPGDNLVLEKVQGGQIALLPPEIKQLPLL